MDTSGVQRASGALAKLGRAVLDPSDGEIAERRRIDENRGRLADAAFASAPGREKRAHDLGEVVVLEAGDDWYRRLKLLDEAPFDAARRGEGHLVPADALSRNA